MAYTVAEAEIRVVPNAKGFDESLRAEIEGKADEIGRAAGDKIGAEIQERVRLALKELPDAKIGVDVDAGRFDTAMAEIKAKAAATGSDSGKALGQNLSKEAANEARGGSPLIMAAVAGGLLAGAPLVIAAGGILMGGLAAAIQHNQPQVQTAAAQVGTAFTEEFGKVTQVTVPALVLALQTVRASAATLAQEAAPAFAALGGPIQNVTQGVIDLARNAMPGLVAAVRDGAPVFAGFQDLLAKIGTGLGDLFSTAAAHASAGGTVFTALGDGLKAVLDALGTLVGVGAELGASILPPIATALQAVADVLAFIAPVLPEVVGAFLAFKAVDLIATGLAAFAASMETVGASAMVAVAELTASEAAGEAAGTGFAVAAAGARTLEGALGPVGWIIAGISLVVPLLVSAFGGQDEKQKQAAASAKDLADAVRQANGAIDESVRKQAALSAQKDGLLDYAGTWGVSSSTIVNAALGQQDAIDEVKLAADHYSTGQLSSADATNAATSAGMLQKQGYQQNAMASDQMLAKLLGLTGATAGGIHDAKQLADAMGQSANATQLNATRLQGLSNTASAASSEINLLKTALDQLSGKQVDLQTAEANVTKAMDAATSSVKGQKGALVDAHGELDVYTAKGAAAQSGLTQMRNAINTEIATLEQQGQTSDQVGAQADQLRQRFIDQARQMGFNQTQAENLANQYLGIPKDVHTEINADTADATAKAAAFKALVESIHDRTVTIETRTVQGPGWVNGVADKPGAAAGGIAVRRYADGGVYTPNMSASVASIVAPGTMRVIGDRAQGDEAFIPINDSARSLAILAQTANRMGYGLHAGGGGGMGQVDARTYHFAISAPSDPAAIAREIRDAQRDLEFLHG